MRKSIEPKMAKAFVQEFSDILTTLQKKQHEVHKLKAKLNALKQSNVAMNILSRS